MDNLVLIRVVRHLRRSLERTALADLREESSHRFRLLFTGETGQRTVLISLRPELPWIGRPVGGWPSSRGAGARFAGACRRALKGSVLTTLEKSDADRVVFLRFAGGESLVAELATPEIEGMSLLVHETEESNSQNPGSVGFKSHPALVFPN